MLKIARKLQELLIEKDFLLLVFSEKNPQLPSAADIWYLENVQEEIPPLQRGHLSYAGR